MAFFSKPNIPGCQSGSANEEHDSSDSDSTVENTGKFKSSRSKPIVMNLRDITSDSSGMKLALVDAIYHNKAHLKKSVIKACAEIVEGWGVNVPPVFVPFNVNGNKLYNSYKNVMTSVSDALKENKDCSNGFGVDGKGRDRKPEYFRVAEMILNECQTQTLRKTEVARAKQARSERMDETANETIASSVLGVSSLKRKIDLKGKEDNFGTSSVKKTYIKPEDPFEAYLSLRTEKLKMDLEDRARAIDLTGDNSNVVTPREKNIPAAFQAGSSSLHGPPQNHHSVGSNRPATVDDLLAVQERMDAGFEEISSKLVNLQEAVNILLTGTTIGK